MKKNKQSNFSISKPRSMIFINPPKNCDFTGSPSILEVALAHDIALNHSCGGMGSCTTCRILVKEGLNSIAPRGQLEAEVATMRSFAENERLACQTLATDGLKVEIPQ